MRLGCGGIRWLPIHKRRVLGWLSARLLLWRHRGRLCSWSLRLTLLVCQRQRLWCSGRLLLGLCCLLWLCWLLPLWSIDQCRGLQLHRWLLLGC